MQSISLINMIVGNKKSAEVTVHLFFQNVSTHLITFAKSSLPWKTAFCMDGWNSLQLSNIKLIFDTICDCIHHAWCYIIVCIQLQAVLHDIEDTNACFLLLFFPLFCACFGQNQQFMFSQCKRTLSPLVIINCSIFSLQMQLLQSFLLRFIIYLCFLF